MHTIFPLPLPSHSELPSLPRCPWARRSALPLLFRQSCFSFHVFSSSCYFPSFQWRGSKSHLADLMLFSGKEGIRLGKIGRWFFFCLQAKCVGGIFFFLREEIFITREWIASNRRVLPEFPWDKGVRSLCAVDVMEHLGLNDQLPSQNNPTSLRERKGLCVALQTRRKRRGGSAWLFLAWWEELQGPWSHHRVSRKHPCWEL